MTKRTNGIGLLPIALIILALAGAVAGQDSRGTMPKAHGWTRLLAIYGGGYHDFVTAARLGTGFLHQPGVTRLKTVMIDPKSAPDQANACFDGIPSLKNRYDVILAYTQGELNLSATTKKKLLEFVRSGGGYVGIHCAADSHPGWSDYDAMMGGRFKTHPPFGKLTVDVVCGNHPITEGLSKQLVFQDEFYYVKNCSPDDKLVLMQARAPDGQVRPVTWVSEYGAGRVFYTILGHDKASWGNPLFQKLVNRAVQWSARAPAQVSEKTYRLLNGRNLGGWSRMGTGSAELKDGALVSRGGTGTLWYTGRRFRDFVLTLEWKVEQPSASASVCLRFPRPPAAPRDAAEQGHEIKLCDESASLPTGQWNSLAITVKGQVYDTLLNGKRVGSITGNGGREGYVGLQNHDDATEIMYRNIQVKILD